MGRGSAIIGAVLALAPLASLAAQQPASIAIDPSLTPYADTTKSVRLPDGRTLHLVCMGQGSPTVIFNGGGDTWSTMWNTVQPEVAKITRTCAWDRQALGLSTAGPDEPTVTHNVSDLEAGLKLAGISGPYIVVGHSLGGYDSVIFADRHKAEVVGMVLVDPTPATDPDAPPDPATPHINILMAGEPPFVAVLRRCAAGLRAGTVRPGAPDPDNCLSPPPPPAEYPPELRDALLELRVGATPEATARALDNLAYYNSATRIADDTRAAYNPARTYGDMPLIVLSAGDAGLSPNNPPEINAELPQLMASKQHAHDHLATLSARGVHRVVADSPHDIPHVKPQAVIDAIDEVVNAARAGGAIPPP